MGGNSFLTGLVGFIVALLLLGFCTVVYGMARYDIATECDDFGHFKAYGQLYTCAKQ